MLALIGGGLSLKSKFLLKKRVVQSSLDSLYLFTDGFADQFGGEKGKKYKYRPFKNLLIEINTKPIDQQELLIKNAFETWRGNLEQIDDVCVIGVRI